ncbi:MAG: phenylalanine--tRNA ligase subunit beta, partial [Ignavibacteriaceae bacterium]
IESAYFNSSSIRKTAKALGLSTDASYRFERGTDPSNTVYAAERTANLIAELAGGEILGGVLDVYPKKMKEKKVKLRYSRVEKILGYVVPEKSIISILRKLGIEIIDEIKDGINVTVPTYRPDIEREIDLIEEIARIYGYDEIPTVSRISITLGEKTDESAFADKIRQAANALGFYEMINNPLQSEKQASISGNPISLKNPLSLDMQCLRTSLLTGALNVVSQNIKYGERDLLLFEIGHVFNKNNDRKIKEFKDFTENQKIILVMTGNYLQNEWNQDEKASDIYTLKGLLKSFERKILLDNVLNDSYYHSEETECDLQITKKYGKKVIGQGGRVKNDVLKQFDIDQEVFCFEFDLEELSKIKIKDRTYSEPLRFPKVIRDFAFTFDTSVQFGEVQEFILSEGSAILKSVNLFDLFEDESLGDDKKSLAFTLEFYSNERTLTEDEVEKEFNKLIMAVTNKFNAKLRGN